MAIPNLFIIGFPKCGTTAIANYLATNPQVYFSRPKEILFWNSDVPADQQIYGATSLEKYLEFFKAAGPQHLAVGEGSTSYIFSSVALQRIRDFNPSARFLVMVRNPVQMLQSWHNWCLWSFLEDVADFESAWNLQGRRAEGLSLPPACTQPKYLQYREIGAFVNYLQPVFRAVPPDKLKIVVLEEFIADPRKSYAEICQFLGVEDDGRADFPPVRESQGHAWPALSKLLWRAPKWLSPIIRSIRLRTWQNPSGFLGNVKNLLCFQKKRRHQLRPEFEENLREIFAGENKRLEDLLGRNLDIWRTNGIVEFQPRAV